MPSSPLLALAPSSKTISSPECSPLAANPESARGMTFEQTFQNFAAPQNGPHAEPDRQAEIELPAQDSPRPSRATAGVAAKARTPRNAGPVQVPQTCPDQKARPDTAATKQESLLVASGVVLPDVEPVADETHPTEKDEAETKALPLILTELFALAIPIAPPGVVEPKTGDSHSEDESSNGTPEGSVNVPSPNLQGNSSPSWLSAALARLADTASPQQTRMASESPTVMETEGSTVPLPGFSPDTARDVLPGKEISTAGDTDTIQWRQKSATELVLAQVHQAEPGAEDVSTEESAAFAASQQEGTPESGVARPLRRPFPAVGGANLKEVLQEGGEASSGMHGAKGSTDMLNAEQSGHRSPQELQSLPSRAAELAGWADPAAPPAQSFGLRSELVQPRSDATAALAMAHFDRSPTPSVSHEVDSLSTSAPLAVSMADLQMDISRAVLELKHLRTESMSVVLRPDGHTELQLQLQVRSGGVEIDAQCRRGDVEHLHAHWPQLQQALSPQGIRLGPLQDSSTSHPAFSGGHNSFQQPAERRPQPEPAPEQWSRPGPIAPRKSESAPGASNRILESWA